MSDVTPSITEQTAIRQSAIGFEPEEKE